VTNACPPRSLTRCVATAIKSVAGGLPIRSLDPAVIAKAQALGAILLSLNGDFADIVAYPPANYLGIVSVQIA
jgi:hypothetical protein